MATGLAAFLFNLSTYWILGNASVMTFTVFSKTKLCATVIGGFIIFKEPFHISQILGISLTLVGVFFYSFAKYVQRRRENKNSKSSSIINVRSGNNGGQYLLPAGHRKNSNNDSSDLANFIANFKKTNSETV